MLFPLQEAELAHPSGCAISVKIGGKGLGWFATFLLMYVCFAQQINS
jgi:hypothetical protein